MDDPLITPDNDAICRSPEAGKLRLGVAGDGYLRWAAVDLTTLLEEVRLRLDLSPVAAVALGRALAATALVWRFSTKSPERLQLEVSGDGPLGKILAEIDENGLLRGLVGAPRLPMPKKGGMKIGWAVGQGTLKVTRMGPRGRYESQVKLVSGELGKDLVHFLEQSQQIRSAALLGVLPRPDGIACAGGVLIEAFPGIPEETLSLLEKNIAEMGGVSEQLHRGGLQGLLDAPLAGMDREDLEDRQLRYGCGQGRDLILGKLRTLPPDDVDDIVDETGRFLADCAFCGRRYLFSRAELVGDDDARPVN